MVAWKFIPLHGSSILLSKDYLKEKKKNFHSYLLCLHFEHGTVLPRHEFLAASVLCLKLKFLGGGDFGQLGEINAKRLDDIGGEQPGISDIERR